MHTSRSRLFLLLLATASGCHLGGAHSDVEGAVLGRVVIYRNGVAFYERKATAHDGTLTVRVPRERVDDFLKSLTVVDPATRKPLSVTIPRKEAYDGSSLTMTLQSPDDPNAEVLMTYVTEAPAWKPSYRVVVGANGKVMLEGWAIVDNVSGEDWTGVLIGVGASSALAFRYDLWSVRRVDRDLLAGEEKFAIAPPTGMSPYANNGSTEELASLGGDEVPGAATPARDTEREDGPVVSQIVSANKAGALAGIVTDNASQTPLAGVTVVVAAQAGDTKTAVTDEHGAYHLDGLLPGAYTVTYYYGDATSEATHVQVALQRTASTRYALKTGSQGDGDKIVVSAKTPTIDQGATKNGMTISDDYVRNVTPGRTFGATLGAAAGSTSDAVGTSFSGSTTLENQCTSSTASTQRSLDRNERRYRKEAAPRAE